MKKRILLFILTAFSAVALSGCGTLGQAVNGVSSIVGLSDSATVISKSAQIRTSYAVVAADLLEVKRGDRLDVLDQIEFEKVLWYRVRAHDEANTEGWIEAQHVITSDLLDKSKKLAEQFKDSQPQAAGQLRAAANLRLSPEMGADKVLLKLANGSSFEIMSWKFVPKQDTQDTDDTKADQKRGPVPSNDEIEAAKDSDEVDKLDEKYDMWYLVKLDPSISPAPAGWLFGRQVELQVPTDIVFYQANNRKFVAWQRLDTDSAEKVVASDKMTTPGSWLVLSRTNVSKPIDGVEPDFDGVQVYAYDKYQQDYYLAYRTGTDVWGQLPFKVEGSGDNKTFTLLLRGPSGKMDEKRFTVFKDKSRLKITPPEDLAQYQQKGK